MNKIRNWGAASLATLAASGAMAQAVDPFDTVMTTQTTNANEWGAALVVLCGIAVGFGIAMKYVRKIRGAA